MSASALALLHDLDPQESGPIFPHRKGWFMSIPVTKEVWKALGIPRFRPHDLRATVASGMDALGIHKEHISRVLNHAEGGTTAGYIRHDHMDQKRRALEASAAHLTAVVEGREKASGVVDFTAAKAGRD